MCARSSSVAPLAILAVCSEVVSETNRLMVEKQEASLSRLSLAGSIFLLQEGRKIEDGVSAVWEQPSRGIQTKCWSRKWSM